MQRLVFCLTFLINLDYFVEICLYFHMKQSFSAYHCKKQNLIDHNSALGKTALVQSALPEFML